MKLLKRKLSAIAMILVMAVAACGMSLFAFADTTENPVDANGWNTQVTRGGALANAGHKLGDENFTSYTDLKDGDVITYGDTIQSPIVSGVVRTMPWQMSFNAEGAEGASLTYEISNGTTVYYKATMVIGGSSFKDAAGFGGVTADRNFESGVTSTLCFEGHHDYGGNVYWVNPKGSFESAYTVCAAMNGNWSSNGKPTSFNLKVTVNGDIDKLSVKVGESVLFHQCNYSTWQWGGYNDGYAAQANCAAQYGIKAPQNNDENFADYFVFKNYEFKFYVGKSNSQADNMPVVTIADQRVDSDNELDESGMFRGYYVHTIPYSYKIKYDHVPAFNIEQGDFKIFYKNGEDTLLTAYVNSGDKAYNHNDLAIKGKFILGWTTDKEGTSDYDFNTPVTGDLTLYAKLGNAVVVNFMDGGTNLGFGNYRTGDIINKIADPEKSGSVFAGWYSDAALTTPFDFTAPIASGVEEINVYAKWNIVVSYRVLGYEGSAVIPQVKNVEIAEGGKITANDFPTFAQITGWPAFSNYELKWFTDNKAKNPLTISADGITINSAVTYYALAVDKSADANETYVRYDLANGFDRNANGVAKDEDENVLTNNSDMNNAVGNVNGVHYGMTAGSYEAKDDGYAKFTMDYVGYVVNARKFDVNKPIYIDYTLKGNAEDKFEGADSQKYFAVWFNNSLTSALTSQGQGHEATFGRIFGWLQWVKKDVQAERNTEMKSISKDGFFGSTFNIDGYDEDVKLEFKVEIGDDNTTVTLVAVGGQSVNKAVSTCLGINKNMFPDGAYVSFSCARPTDVTARVTQDGSTATVADSATGLAITTEKAATGMLAGEKVEFTVTPPAGYFFTPDGVFANGKQLTVLGDETNGYYFNMPLGTNEITINYGINITFVADGKTIEEKAALMGQPFAEVNTPTAPAKTGYKKNVIWCTDEALTAPYDFSTIVDDAITLYAKYVPEQYSLTIVDPADSSAIGDVIKADFGSKYVRPAADPVKDGFVFKGYYSDEACTEEYDWNTVVTAENRFVYAKFEAVQTPDDKEDGKKDKGCGSMTAASSAIGAALALALASCVVFIKKKETGNR